MEFLTVKLTGTHPLLMHADRLANPLDQATKVHKEMTSKRKKTDDDHEAIGKSEFFSSLYIDNDGPFLPSMNVDAAFVEAAKMQRMGKHVKRAMMVVENRISLQYIGPRDRDGLWADKRFVDARSVRVSTAKLVRYRPCFDDWSAVCKVAINTDQINLNEAKQIIKNAGALVGVGDFRPRFGRFAVDFIEG